MSDETATETETTDAPTEEVLGEDGAPAKKKMAGKTLVLFVILPALVLILGGGGAAMMLLGGGKAEAAVAAEDGEEGEAPEPKGKGKGKSPEPEGKGKGKSPDPKGKGKGGSTAKATESEGNGAVIQIGEPGQPSFYTMPNLLVTVNSGGGRRSQLLLKLTLETSDPALFDKIDAVLPRVTDQFQMFLRELRIDDLSGSAGDYRIRRELLRRVNLSLYPEKIDAVLIEEFIVQ